MGNLAQERLLANCGQAKARQYIHNEETPWPSQRPTKKNRFRNHSIIVMPHLTQIETISTKFLMKCVINESSKYLEDKESLGFAQAWIFLNPNTNLWKSKPQYKANIGVF